MSSLREASAGLQRINNSLEGWVLGISVETLGVSEPQSCLLNCVTWRSVAYPPWALTALIKAGKVSGVPCLG